MLCRTVDCRCTRPGNYSSVSRYLDNVMYRGTLQMPGVSVLAVCGAGGGACHVTWSGQWTHQAAHSHTTTEPA